MTDTVEKMKADTLKRLRYARALLTKGWIQCAGSLDKNGDSVAPWSPEAVCWCATGAIEAALPKEFDYEEFTAAAKEIYDVAYKLPMAANMHAIRMVEMWNDEAGRKQADVLDAFDAAIERLEKST